MFFSKNSRKFATSPLPTVGCYLLYKKLPANRNDCTLAFALRALKVSYSDVGEGRVEMNCEKTHLSEQSVCILQVKVGLSWQPRPLFFGGGREGSEISSITLNSCR